MGGTCDVQEEPGKQNTRSCRAQELARSSAQENTQQKKELTGLREYTRRLRELCSSNTFLHAWIPSPRAR